MRFGMGLDQTIRNAFVNSGAPMRSRRRRRLAVGGQFFDQTLFAAKSIGQLVQLRHVLWIGIGVRIDDRLNFLLPDAMLQQGAQLLAVLQDRALTTVQLNVVLGVDRLDDDLKFTN